MAGFVVSSFFEECFKSGNNIVLLSSSPLLPFVLIFFVTVGLIQIDNAKIVALFLQD